jgi:hypothetical protein
MKSQSFDNLVDALSYLANAPIKKPALSSFDLRRLLRFLSKVIQVVEQAFQDVLGLMIEFKYLSETDQQAGKLTQLAKELELLGARSRYRDAEEICSRLHNLTAYYHSEIESVTRNLPNSHEWQHILRLLDEHEGYIIELVNQSVRELQELLQESDFKRINVAAGHGVDKIRDSLSRLRSLNSQILGLSGNVGLLELTEEKDGSKKTSIDVKIGDVYNVNGQVGAAGPNAEAHDMTFKQISGQITNTINLEELSKELTLLRQAMKKESVTVEHDIAVGEMAKAEQAAKSKDLNKVAKYLKAAGKWALDIAAQIGVTVAIEALKQAVNVK